MARRSRRRVQLEDPGKFFLFLTIEACATLALIAGRIAESTWLALTLGVLGYLTGNGRLARRGKSTVPTIAPARRRRDDPPEPPED